MRRSGLLSSPGERSTKRLKRLGRGTGGTPETSRAPPDSGPRGALPPAARDPYTEVDTAVGTARTGVVAPAWCRVYRGPHVSGCLYAHGLGSESCFHVWILREAARREREANRAK